MWIGLGFDVWPQWRKSVERLGAGPLALAILDRAVADILRSGVAEDIPGRRGRCDIADAPPDYDAQFRLVIGAMIGKGDFDPAAIGDEGRGGFDPKQRLFGQR